MLRYLGVFLMVTFATGCHATVHYVSGDGDRPSVAIRKALEAAKGLLPAFVHNFKMVTITAQDNRTTTAGMKRYRAYAASNYSISTSMSALELGIQLVNRYIKYQQNPGKQVQFFNRVIRQAHHDKKSAIDSVYVLNQFIQYTGLPSILLDDAIPLPKSSLLSFFQQRIKGQDSVLEQLCTLIQTFKAGINDPQKPIATLLFAGPTGVGKTAAAKALAEYFFASGQSQPVGLSGSMRAQLAVQLNPLLRGLSLNSSEGTWHYTCG